MELCTVYFLFKMPVTKFVHLPIYIRDLTLYSEVYELSSLLYFVID